jgi:hypothetical protein
MKIEVVVLAVMGIVVYHYSLAINHYVLYALGVLSIYLEETKEILSELI